MHCSCPVHVATCCMQGITLTGLTEKCHPEQEPTNRLAALKAKQLKAGVARPFPWILLAWFLPSWAEDVGVPGNLVADAADCEQQRDEQGDLRCMKKPKLDLARWLAAYQCYALAASAADVCPFMHQPFAGVVAIVCSQVWQYTAAMAHMRVCLEVAVNAAAEEKRYSLAVVYDEVCRKEWHKRASRGERQSRARVEGRLCLPIACAGDQSFDVNVVSLEKDHELLDRARMIYKAQSKPMGKGDSVSLSYLLALGTVCARQCREAQGCAGW